MYDKYMFQDTVFPCFHSFLPNFIYLTNKTLARVFFLSLSRTHFKNLLQFSFYANALWGRMNFKKCHLL